MGLVDVSSLPPPQDFVWDICDVPVLAQWADRQSDHSDKEEGYAWI